MNKVFSKEFWSKRRIFGVFLLIIFCLFVYQRFFRSAASSTQVQTAKVTKGTIVSSVSASGNILTSNILPITSSAAGVVTKVLIHDGDKVAKGQKIAEIELDPAGAQNNSSDYAAYLSAKNNLESAKNDLNTLQAAMFSANQKFINDAVARGLTTDDPTYIQENATWLASENKYNQQKQVIAQAQIAVDSAFLNYQNSSSNVFATASGTIQNITIVPGMSLSFTSSSGASSSAANGKRIAVIKIEGTPLASFNISEVDVSKIQQGQKATITLDSIPGKTFTGRVISVDKIGTSSSNVTTYPVIIQLDSNASDILPNMAASTNIILETKDNVLLVPNASLSTINGQSAVRIMRNGKEEVVTVQTGLTSDTQTEIVSGLSEGNTVVISTSTNTSGSQTSSGRSVFSGGGLGGSSGRFVTR